MNLAIEDRGFLALRGDFDFGNATQGFGYAVDTEFVAAFIRACGAEDLASCKGRVVQVDHDWGKIYAVAPMPFGKGDRFDIEAWAARKRSRAPLTQRILDIISEVTSACYRIKALEGQAAFDKLILVQDRLAGLVRDIDDGTYDRVAA